MKINLSPALRDISLALGIDVNALGPKSNLEMPKIFCKNGVTLTNPKRYVDPTEYAKEISTASLAAAISDLELRENKFSPNLGGKRWGDISSVTRCGIEVALSLYEMLCKSQGVSDWVIWLSIGNQLGEYEATLEDLKSISLAEVLDGRRPWWYSFDISFARLRDAGDYLEEIYISKGWGQSLSPFQAILMPV